MDPERPATPQTRPVAAREQALVDRWLQCAAMFADRIAFQTAIHGNAEKKHRVLTRTDAYASSVALTPTVPRTNAASPGKRRAALRGPDPTPTACASTAWAPAFRSRTEPAAAEGRRSATDIAFLARGPAAAIEPSRDEGPQKSPRCTSRFALVRLHGKNREGQSPAHPMRRRVELGRWLRTYAMGDRSFRAGGWQRTVSDR
jgi:hypothetical protein